MSHQANPADTADDPLQEGNVPTYAYACTACDHRFEAQQAFSDDALTECPECTGRLRKLFNSVGIVFKGSGFYRTDSRGAQSGGEGGSSTSSSSESSTSSGSGSSSDSSGSSSTPSAAPAAASTSGGSSGSSGSSGSGSSGSGSSGGSSSGAKAGSTSAA